MYIFLQSIYKNFQVIINKIFETLTMRTGPDYEKLSDDEGIVYFDNPLRK